MLGELTGEESPEKHRGKWELAEVEGREGDHRGKRKMKKKIRRKKRRRRRKRKRKF